ncbi:MAG: hypothetical protein M3P44_08745 [Actinomycetota bacterium]|nr:hypothetical protein [Actinomycetota bacterium]
MLAVSTYDQEYIDRCRTAVDRRVAAYDDVAAATKDEAALDAFAPLFFNALVIVLDACFVHRVRNKEGKDGNPVNEVRVLSSSLLENDAVMAAGTTMRLKPETSVLGLAVGDEIAVGREGFARLAAAYFTEIETRYGGGA